MTNCKFNNKKLTNRNRNFKFLSETFHPEPYTREEENKWWNSIKTDLLLMPENAVAQLLFEPIAKSFKLNFNLSSAEYEIVRCFNTMIHKEVEHKNSLFINVVLHTGVVPHILAQVSDNRKVSENYSLVRGSAFLFDPHCWHSTISRSREMSELVLVRCVIPYLAKDRAAILKKHF